MSNDDFDTTTWTGLRRLLACTWPVWMLAPSVRRAAERDPLLEWDAPRKCWRRRRDSVPVPSSPAREAKEETGA